MKKETLNVMVVLQSLSSSPCISRSYRFLELSIFFAFQKETSSLPKLDLNLEDAAYALGHTEQQTLLVSTLDGSLKAIDMAKGEVIWELSDEPVVRSPYDSSNPVLPAFLPDPKDGSLYMIGSGMKEPLKKLPFTIPGILRNFIIVHNIGHIHKIN